MNRREILEKANIIPTWLDPDERLKLIELAHELQAGDTIVEVGALYGGSTACLALGAPGSHVYSHDNFSWTPPGWEHLPASRAQMQKFMDELGITNVEIIEGDSREEGPKWARRAAVKQPIALLWIDGGHSYEFAKADLTNFGPYAKVIALHDYHDPTWAPHIQRAVKEFLDEHPDCFWVDYAVKTLITLRRL